MYALKGFFLATHKRALIVLVMGMRRNFPLSNVWRVWMDARPGLSLKFAPSR
jgi:hypothetical protein